MMIHRPFVNGREMIMILVANLKQTVIKDWHLNICACLLLIEANDRSAIIGCLEVFTSVESVI